MKARYRRKEKMNGYCGACIDMPLDKEYHDNEWGIPVHDDKKQFEFLCLEALQCGLSWELMLKKRKTFEECFSSFDYEKVANYTEKDIQRILNTPNMIKSKGKIEAVINNAICFLEVRKIYGTFSAYIWFFTKGKTILYKGHEKGRFPASNVLSEKISKNLRAKGFRYVGPVVIYSHLQATGIINDHVFDCPIYKNILENYPTVIKRGYKEKF